MGNVMSKTITSFEDDASTDEDDATVGNSGLRRKLNNSERRICPHCLESVRWIDNLKDLLQHCKNNHKIEAKNFCQFCKAPFGNLLSSKKDRDIHEAKDHPPTSDTVKQKQKKHTHSGGKAKKSGKARK